MKNKEFACINHRGNIVVYIILELEQLNQIKVKQLKNRYNDPAVNRAFIVGVDRSKMRLYDVEQSAQQVVDSNQESPELVEQESGPRAPAPEDAYNKFSDFKI